MTVDLRLAIPACIAWIAAGVFLGVPAALPAFAVVIVTATLRLRYGSVELKRERIDCVYKW
jgi:hypothetical protein